MLDWWKVCGELRVAHALVIADALKDFYLAHNPPNFVESSYVIAKATGQSLHSCLNNKYLNGEKGKASFVAKEPESKFDYRKVET